MFDKIKQNDSAKLMLSLTFVVIIFVCLQGIGALQGICTNFRTTVLALSGYESKEYVVSASKPIPIAMMIGVNIEQEIYLTEDIVEQDEFMLEIDVANYDRINEGQLVLEIHQSDIVKVYVTDMAAITENKTLRLITDTQGLKKGNVMINMYAPEATGENCIAVYSVNDTSVYTGLIVCGEVTKSNACIDLAIPSDFAKSDFVQVTVE